MIYEKDVDEEIQQVKSLQNMVSVYGEIASVRMLKIRHSVLLSREFLNAIHNIFQEVLSSYAQKASELVKKGKLKLGSKITFLSHNGKTVAVFISANTGFYGDIVQKTFTKFLEEVRSGDEVEVAIVGRLGLSLFQEAEPNRPYTYFNLSDFGIDRAQLDELIKHLVQYDEIRLYYGQYENIVKQVPTEYTISAGATVEESKKAQVEYIFEPSIEKILEFFETEIFASVFDQSVRESQLAKFASRMMAMDAAGENIRQEIKDLNAMRLRFEHRIANRKQLNSMAAAVLALE